MARPTDEARVAHEAPTADETRVAHEAHETHAHGSLRHRLFEIIQPAQEGDVLSLLFDVGLIALIIVNAVLAVAETFPIDALTRRVLYDVELISIVLFTIEYLVRIATADLLYPELGPIRARLRYMTSAMGIIDLVSILPFYLTSFITLDLRALRMLRLFRLLRVFKLGNYFDGLGAIWRAISSRRDELVSSTVTIAILMMVAAVIMYYVEGDAQPDAFGNAFDALWWAICTLTTVGYGDVYPVTTAGRVLSAIIALLGIGLVAVPTGIITSAFTEQIGESRYPLLHVGENASWAARRAKGAGEAPDVEGRENTPHSASEHAHEHAVEHAAENAREHAIEHAHEHAHERAADEHTAHAGWHYCPYCGERLED